MNEEGKEKPLNKVDELRFNLERLKMDPTYQYVMSYVAKWKEGALNDILDKEISPAEKGEFKAYGRVMNLIDYLIRTLGNQSDEPNLDPYKDSHGN